MVTSRKDNHPLSKRPPATTPQGMENQMIALAFESVERRILSNTASSQELVHFLKLGTERERLERLKLEQETELAKARVEQLAEAANLTVLMTEAMDAFRGYQPSGDNEIE